MCGLSWKVKRFHYQKQYCSNTTMKHQRNAVDQANHKEPKFVIEMSLLDVMNVVKERRFRLRSRDECRLHHNEITDPNWKCSDFPYEKMTCEEEEEREEAGKCIEAAHVHLLAKAATYAVSQIVLARLVSTSPAMSKPEEKTPLRLKNNASDFVHCIS